MDRPSRNKKSVDYSQFMDLEDDDEDFAASAPVSKKARVEPKKEKREKPIKKTHKEEVTPDNSQKKRLPLEDKLYQRDLEVALALSVKETSVVIENDKNISRNGINSPSGPEVSAPCTPEDTYTCIKEPDVSERSFTNCSVDGSTLGLDEITDDNEDMDRGRGRRQAASKAITEQRKLLREDSGDEEEEDEFNPYTAAHEDSESDASFSGEDDEEFEVKKSKKQSTSKSAQKQKPKNGKKEKKVPKAQKVAAAEPPIKVKIKIKPMPERKAPASSPAAPKAALHSSPSVGIKRPAWTPPASCGAVKSPLAGVTVRSPNQGLRLGLSRLARVKPLHPSTGLH